MTHLLLISKPGLVSHSLLAYCRSLVSRQIQAELMEPVEYLRLAGQVAADLIVILDGDNTHEVEQVIDCAAGARQRAIVIVDDIYRQRILRAHTEQPVLIWGLINQNPALYLFDR